MSTTTYFLWRNKKNIITFWLKKAYFLELCSTFNIKTAPLRPLLGSTKADLNSGILLYWKPMREFLASTASMTTRLWDTFSFTRAYTLHIFLKAGFVYMWLIF